MPLKLVNVPAPQLGPIIALHAQQTRFPLAFILKLAVESILLKHYFNSWSGIDEPITDQVNDFLLNPANGLFTPQQLDHLEHSEPTDERMWALVVAEINQVTDVTLLLAQQIEGPLLQYIPATYVESAIGLHSVLYNQGFMVIVFEES